MSKCVATINGKNIYSDKTIKSIADTRINFSDGSWCDIASGKVVNKGAGYISIDSLIDAEPERTSVEKKIFAGKLLKVMDLSAVKLDVLAHDGHEIEVEVEGEADKIKNIKVYQLGDSVIIKGESEGSRKFQSSSFSISKGNVSSSIISSSGHITISGRNISVTTDGIENEAKIIVKVPKGLPVSISNVNGNTTIGDTNGPLQLNAVLGEVYVGSVADAAISIRGGTDVEISRVDGDLSIIMQGSGDVRVREGKIRLLNASLQGSGDINIGGEAENANLSLMGSGDIDVSYVKNRPTTFFLGSGDINVGNWPNLT